MVAICRDICGVQAQVMSAAHLQLWARNHSITRREIEDALWKKRTLIKSSFMRQTLHLIPADEFPLYIAALRSTRVADAFRVMSRFGITREEADDLTELIMQALASGPLKRADITAAVRPKVSKRVRAWMEKVFTIVRLPIAEGLICYGSGEGNQVKLIRLDHWMNDRWMKKQGRIAEPDAQAALLRKYLLAYGPATLQDFSKWSGIRMAQVKPLGELIREDVVEVQIENSKRLLLKKDRAVLKKSAASDSVRLLPAFDPFLLAHAEKDDLIARAHYKWVYRSQWWISAVVLVNGKIAGTWKHTLRGDRVVVSVEAFEKFPRTVREQIHQEALSLAKFLDRKLEVAF